MPSLNHGLDGDVRPVHMPAEHVRTASVPVESIIWSLRELPRSIRLATTSQWYRRGMKNFASTAQNAHHEYRQVRSIPRRCSRYANVESHSRLSLAGFSGSLIGCLDSIVADISSYEIGRASWRERV